MERINGLERVAERVADGDAVNWDGEESASASEAESRQLGHLRLVHDLGVLLRGEMVSEASGTIEATMPSGSSAEVRDSGARAALAGSGEPATETNWGPLQLLEKMGEGAFGEVYRAWDRRLQRQVALKLLKTKLDDSQDWEARVLHEGRLLAKVDHPHIATIYGVENHDGRLGIWMEFIEGADLYQHVHDHGLMDPREAALIGMDLCAALAAVHGAGVVHRDVKARNVMREQGGRIVLMDFGAGARRHGLPGGPISGTPLYMAPEVFSQGDATPRSDLYSLGVLLFYLVSREHPVQGNSLAEITQAHESGDRVHLRDLRSELPAPFVGVIEKALAGDSDDRYRSAGEMEAALGGYLDSARTSGEFARPGGVEAHRKPNVRLLSAVLVLAAALAVFFGRSLFTPPELEAAVEFAGHRGDAVRELSLGDVLQKQEQLEIVLQLNRDAFVYVINLDAVGSATVMYPMAGDEPPAALPARRQHRLPGTFDGKQLAWSFAGQGVEQFLVVASLEPLTDFELELDKLPSVALGGGLTAKPAGEHEDAMWASLTRGVVGVSEIESATQAASAENLFDLARRLQDGESGSGRIWLHHMSLMNPGQR